MICQNSTHPCFFSSRLPKLSYTRHKFGNLKNSSLHIIVILNDDSFVTVLSLTLGVYLKKKKIYKRGFGRKNPSQRWLFKSSWRSPTWNICNDDQKTIQTKQQQQHKKAPSVKSAISVSFLQSGKLGWYRHPFLYPETCTWTPTVSFN